LCHVHKSKSKGKGKSARAEARLGRQACATQSGVKPQHSKKDNSRSLTTIRKKSATGFHS